MDEQFGIKQGIVNYNEPDIIQCPHCNIRVDIELLRLEYPHYCKLVKRNFKDRPYDIMLPVTLCPNCHKEFATGCGREL